ncbi:unnamed protein product [Pseudo-nitzschia multistriata]|uniref:Tetrahydrofolate dehydrogenase/cyclohydrolase NAD(P)-binding domain-containing protein n=1 Tax=Pseudo-nitzschia multistriata TaxID=183589 RepID=A0A448ZFU8_9STRA|nr:unnamed protein product [Pseudo-nitzschia multistriata]
MFFSTLQAARCPYTARYAPNIRCTDGRFRFFRSLAPATTAKTTALFASRCGHNHTNYRHPRRRGHCRRLSTESVVTAPADWNALYPSPSAIDVSPLACSLRARVREYTSENGRLKLIGVLANEGSHRINSDLYSERIKHTFEEDGIDYEVWRYPELESRDNGSDKEQQAKIQWIKDRIHRINERTDIDGALVFYPIYPFGPKGPYKNKLMGVYYKTQDDHIRDLLLPGKDVEGLCRNKWFKIRDSKQKNSPATYPCTALSVLKILEEYHMGRRNNQPNDCWKDQTICIINRSEIMGRPLAVMLAKKGATVYSIDIDSILQFRPDGKRLRRCNPATTSLESCTRESNVVVAGVPQASFRIPISSIREGATIVNVAEVPNVCEATLFRERPDVRYIPQVGKVTVATLSLNLMNLKVNRPGSS